MYKILYRIGDQKLIIAEVRCEWQGILLKFFNVDNPVAIIKL